MPPLRTASPGAKKQQEVLGSRLERTARSRRCPRWCRAAGGTLSSPRVPQKPPSPGAGGEVLATPFAPRPHPSLPKTRLWGHKFLAGWHRERRTEWRGGSREWFLGHPRCQGGSGTRATRVLAAQGQKRSKPAAVQRSGGRAATEPPGCSARPGVLVLPKKKLSLSPASAAAAGARHPLDFGHREGTQEIE